MFAVGIAPTREARAVVDGAVATPDGGSSRPGRRSTRTSTSPRARRDAGTLWPETVHARLKRIKKSVDPENVIRSNHPL